ncbi:MAG: hypothetical protein N2A99_04095 [Carnobacterium alterfunditum]
MKKNILLIAVSLSFLFLIKFYLDEKETRIEGEEEIQNLQKIVEIERFIPNVNEKAKSFVKALNKSEHKEFLTGDSLREYNEAIQGNYEDGHEEHEEYEEIDVTMQDVEILFASTESNEDGEVSSKVLYQLSYKGIFDNEELGVIDQRILTILMDIDWIEDDSEMLINKYNVTLIEEDLGESLLEESKGSDS